MVIMCLVMSYYLLFTDMLLDKGLYGFKRHLFVVILLVYASYRSFRLYTEIKKDRAQK